MITGKSGFSISQDQRRGHPIAAQDLVHRLSGPGLGEFLVLLDAHNQDFQPDEQVLGETQRSIITTLPANHAVNRLHTFRKDAYNLLTLRQPTGRGICVVYCVHKQSI